MKQIVLMLTVLTFILACKSKSKIVSQTEHMDVISQKALKGNWQITDVTFTGPDYYKVKAFQIADAKCFIGSQWNFIPSSNKGTLNLTKTDCPAVNSPIVWSINKQGLFGLKILNSGEKARKTDQGFMLKFSDKTETSFKLIDEVDVGNTRNEVIYKFEKQ